MEGKEKRRGALFSTFLAKRRGWGKTKTPPEGMRLERKLSAVVTPLLLLSVPTTGRSQ